MVGPEFQVQKLEPKNGSGDPILMVPSPGLPHNEYFRHPVDAMTAVTILRNRYALGLAVSLISVIAATPLVALKAISSAAERLYFLRPNSDFLYNLHLNLQGNMPEDVVAKASLFMVVGVMGSAFGGVALHRTLNRKAAVQKYINDNYSVPVNIPQHPALKPLAP